MAVAPISPLSVAVALLAAGLTPVTVLAQRASDNRDDLDTIYVIGTRAAERTALDTPVAVDVLSEDELQTTGAVAGELGQALATVAPSFNFPRQSNSGTSDAVRAGQLRGLSPDQMLVLVNGRRRHTSAIVNSETKIGRGTAAVDFNFLPLNAIKRVEVLRDGAGALYGSDAIAGVVNVVFDDSPGFESNISYGLHNTDLDPINARQTDGETFTLDAKYGWQLGDDGFFKFGAAYRTRDKTNRAGFDPPVPDFIIDPNDFLPDGSPDNNAVGGQRNYTEGDPNVDEVNLWFNGVLPLGGGELYGHGTFGNRDTDGGAAFFRYPDAPDNVKSIFPGGYRPETKAEDTDYAATIGFRSELATWMVDAALGYGNDEFEYGVENSLNPSLGPTSPTSFKSGTYEVEQILVSLDVSRDFDVGLAGGPLAVAVGAEFRQENYDTTRGQLESYVAGRYGNAGCADFDDPLILIDDVDFFCDVGAEAGPGLTPEDEVSIDRNVVSFYVDAGADVTDVLFLDVAARFEDYDDFGSALTGKLAARYEISDGLALRAAVSNSFRAPNIAQLGFADTSTSFGENRALIRTRTLRVDNPIARVLGSQDLDEEKSKNLSAGFVYAQDVWTLTVDAFQIEVDDRITLSERLFGEDVEDAIAGLPGADGVQSVRFFTNAVDTRTRGVDAVLTYAAPLLSGDGRLSAAYNYSRTGIRGARTTNPQLQAIDPSLSLIGVEERNTLETAAPRSKLILTGNWSGEIVDALVRVSRYDSTTRVFNFGGGFEPTQTYGPENQVDVEVGVRPTEGLNFHLGISNLFDNYPERSSDDINFFGNLPYDILSPIGVNGRFWYVRATYSM